MTNCPNCGAPITGWKCEYCGTVFDISKKVTDDDISALEKCILDYNNSIINARVNYEQEYDAIKRLYDDISQLKETHNAFMRITSKYIIAAAIPFVGLILSLL